MVKKKFDMVKWRHRISLKIGLEVSQEGARKLLGFKNVSSIQKIEQGLSDAREQTVRYAEAIYEMPADNIKIILMRR